MGSLFRNHAEENSFPNSIKPYSTTLSYNKFAISKFYPRFKPYSMSAFKTNNIIWQDVISNPNIRGTVTVSMLYFILSCHIPLLSQSMPSSIHSLLCSVSRFLSTFFFSSFCHSAPPCPNSPSPQQLYDYRCSFAYGDYRNLHFFYSAFDYCIPICAGQIYVKYVLVTVLRDWVPRVWLPYTMMPFFQSISPDYSTPDGADARRRPTTTRRLQGESAQSGID